MPAPGPKTPATQNAGKRAVQTKDLKDRALECRIAGMNYKDIGAVIGRSRSQASKLVYAALVELNTEITEKATEVRELELARLDAIVMAHWANKGDPRRAEVILKAMDRRSRLLGLDAPVKQEIAGPNQGPIAVKHDLTKLTIEELAALDTMLAKTEGAE